MNWQDYDFPAAAGTMNLEDAYRILYAKHDLKLKYARIYNYEPNNESTIIKLAYMLDNLNGMIDAKSGKFVDYSGKPIQEAGKVLFTDIAGHKYEKDIQLLVELGILDSTTGKFNPDSKVLQKDFVKLLMKAVQPVYYPIPYALSDSSEYDSYYENAVQQGIMAKKDKKTEASKMMVKALGAGFVAELGGIFNLNLKDASAITAENKGYAAIAAALGLVDTAGETFGPALELTRGETAAMLVSLLKVEKNPVTSQVSGATAEAVEIMPINK